MTGRPGTSPPWGGSKQVMNPLRATACRPVLWALLLASAPALAGPVDQDRGVAVVPPGDVTAVVLPPPLSMEPIDAGAVRAWVDRWFAKRLADRDAAVPGAVVAVVQGEKVLLVKGYGLADLASRTPAGPDTVFRVGSVSKSVTATAVMQLVEAGVLDLRQPVAAYVHDVPLPVAFGRAVTVLDLVTHTGGFDVRLAGTAAPSDEAVQPLGAYLRTSMPPQVRQSGSVLSYSNHGYSLLGHVVEAISGESFERYAEDRIFRPLGMTRSGFRLTPGLESLAATGYEPSPGGFRRGASVHPNIYPAAGLNTTASDMARFMGAQLNGGRGGDGRILGEASVAAMHRQQFTMSPAMPGVAFGFFETFELGERALVHGGGIRGFMSGLALWPERRLGLFVSNNGYSDALVRDLIVAFGRRFVSPPNRPTARRSDSLLVERLAGSYRPVSQARWSLEKAGALRTDDLEFGLNYWRHLTIGRDEFVEVAPGVFGERYGAERVAFVEAPVSHSMFLLTTDPFNGNAAWEKLAWYETGRCHRELLFVFTVAFLSALVVPYRRLALLCPDAPVGTHSGGGPVIARVLLATVAAVNLSFLVLLVIAFRLERDTGLLYGIPALARRALWLPVGAAVASAGLPWFVWRAWRAGYWSPPARVHYTATTAAAIGFAAWCWYWNLLGA